MPIQRLDKRSGNGERIKGYILQCLLACHRLFLFVDKNHDRGKAKFVSKDSLKITKNGCILTGR